MSSHRSRGTPFEPPHAADTGASNGGGGVAHVLAMAASAALLVTIVLKLSKFPYDDAYIHMRVARNLAFEGAPFFNTDERVFATSSPLWMVLLAAVFRIAGRADVALVVGLAIASVLGLLAAAGELLSATLGRRTVTSALLAGALVTAFAVTSGGFLMETPLALGLLLLAVRLFVAERHGPAGAALALAAATRYELFAAAAMAVVAAPDRSRRRKLLLGFLPVFALEMIALAVTYGAVVPNTMGAKSRVFVLTFEEWSQVMPSGAAGAAALILAGGACARLLLREGNGWSRSVSWRSMAMLAGFSSLLLGIYVARLTFASPWYHPLTTVPLAVGVVALVSRELRSGTPKRKRLAALVASLFVAGSANVAWQNLTDVMAGLRGRFADSTTMTDNARTRAYEEAAGLVAAACPGASVLAPEIGAVGWAFPGRIIDAVGLATPNMLQFHPLAVPEERPSGSIGAIPARAVTAFKPDVLVTMDIFAHDVLKRLPGDAFLRSYGLRALVPVMEPALVAQGFRSRIWNSDNVGVMVRQGACPNLKRNTRSP